MLCYVQNISPTHIFFENFIHAYNVWIKPTSPFIPFQFLLYVPITTFSCQLHVVFLKPLSLYCCPDIHGCGTSYRGMDSLSGATSLMKTHSP